jgi:alkanesulfonate monooxygenase SsuD/methylene tetrahydromethanopterin reductase-like flavin-dependent oxidoreductase (luciferase family)
MAKKTGQLCDGLLTPGANDEKLRLLLSRFEEGARAAGKDPRRMPRMIQVHVSWAETDEQAIENALREWPNGGMAFPKGDIRNPEDFQAMARLVRPEHFQGRVFMTSDLDRHGEFLQHLIDLGFTEIYVHNVGRNQEEFIRAYGRAVIPHLRWPADAPVAQAMSPSASRAGQ